MNMDIRNSIDNINDGTREVADTATEKTSEFHNCYVSKVVPDCGKYGDQAKFAAELVPGVSEYNAVREGDWQAFAIAAGIDVAAVAAGAFTAGAGYAAVKGGTTIAKAGVKAAVKEVAETGAKSAAKETAEKGAATTLKEVSETGAEKITKEASEKITETTTKEVDEVSQIVKNKLDGTAREEEVLKDLISEHGEESILREQLLRNSSGEIIKDVETGAARRIDCVVVKGDKVVKSIEVTSETAPKAVQTAKELRILEQARESGGAFIKDSTTGKLYEFPEQLITEIRRLP